MPFEHAIETVNSGGVHFHFPLDHAYWMSGLEPVDWKDGVASFDGRSLAIPDLPHSVVPETGPPATAYQNYPYVMTGQAWKIDESAPTPTSNDFDLTLSGARAVTLDTTRMRLQDWRLVFGELKTDSALTLTLNGGWPRGVIARLDCRRIAVSRRVGAITVGIPAGQHGLSIGTAAATRCPQTLVPPSLDSAGGAPPPLLPGHDHAPELAGGALGF
jgi:hypothetical protein